VAGFAGAGVTVAGGRDITPARPRWRPFAAQMRGLRSIWWTSDASGSTLRRSSGAGNR